MTQPETTRSDGSPTQRKATLFCWECDHSSPIDGDWLQRPRSRHVAYVCPVCETTLTKRPTDGPSPVLTAVWPISAWRRTLRTATTVWRATVGIGFSGLTALAGGRPTADQTPL